MRPFSIFRVFAHCESGATLVETVVALAVLGTISVTFLSGLVTSSKAAFTADERATAESLAQSLMEWAENATYNNAPFEYSPAPIPVARIMFITQPTLPPRFCPGTVPMTASRR